MLNVSIKIVLGKVIVAEPWFKNLLRVVATFVSDDKISRNVVLELRICIKKRENIFFLIGFRASFSLEIIKRVALVKVKQCQSLSLQFPISFFRAGRRSFFSQTPFTASSQQPTTGKSMSSPYHLSKDTTSATNTLDFSNSEGKSNSLSPTFRSRIGTAFSDTTLSHLGRILYPGLPVSNFFPVSSFQNEVFGVPEFCSHRHFCRCDLLFTPFWVLSLLAFCWRRETLLLTPTLCTMGLFWSVDYPPLPLCECGQKSRSDSHKNSFSFFNVQSFVSSPLNPGRWRLRDKH